MKRKKMFLLIFILLLISMLDVSVAYSFINRINDITDIYFNKEEKVVIVLKNKSVTSCFIGNDLEKASWTVANNKKCILDFKKGNYIFLRNKSGLITKYDNNYDYSLLKEFTINKSKIYLALNDKVKINYTLDYKVNRDIGVSFKSLDENIVTVNESGEISGIGVGQTKVAVSFLNEKREVDVIVTDLIIKKGNEYDYKRKYVSCGEYSEEDNDLIDEILIDRINSVGFKTRAAVVEAARFITLEFAKRIPYFAENGRMSINGIDGEGRFYHKGLYLNESRLASITKSMYGKNPWGCKMYSYPVKRVIPNGLDCSGFVSWVFYNAGFDVGDIGAGITSVTDFTDLGIKRNIKEAIDINKIIVGDLLSGKYSTGGHIAIVSGITDTDYYISESVYEDSHTYYGLITRKYSKEELPNYFSWQIDMSEFYESDGLLTNFWLD